MLINSDTLTLYNGVSIFGQFPPPNGQYFIGNMTLPDSVNFTAVIDTSVIHHMGYTLTCPVSGIINFTSYGSDTLYFAVNCNSNYDSAIASSGNPFKIGNSVLISVGVNDISCVL